MSYGIAILKDRLDELTIDYNWVVKCQTGRNINKENQDALEAIKARMINLESDIKILEQCSL